jgi:hypothetical protein
MRLQCIDVFGFLLKFCFLLCCKRILLRGFEVEDGSKKLLPSDENDSQFEVTTSFVHISHQDALSSKIPFAAVDFWMWDRSTNEWSVVVVGTTDLTKHGIMQAVNEKNEPYKQHLEKYCPTSATMYYPRQIRSALYHVLSKQDVMSGEGYEKDSAEVYRPKK